LRRVTRLLLKALLTAIVATGILLGAARYASLPPLTETRTGSVSPQPTTSANASGGTRAEVRVVVLVDNEEYVKGLRTAWGLAIYVETPHTKFLFDTGPTPAVLKYNAARLGINLSEVDFVVISHCHGDHVGGLPLIAKLRPGLRVYVPASSGLQGYVRGLGLTPVPVNNTLSVAPGVWVLKPLYGPPWEEGVAVATRLGLVVLVGCSHPGVNNIVAEAVKDLGTRKVYAVIGGFHLGGAPREEIAEEMEDLASLGVVKVYPLHCSGEEVKEYLREKHPSMLGVGGVGLVLTFPAPEGCG